MTRLDFYVDLLRLHVNHIGLLRALTDADAKGQAPPKELLTIAAENLAHARSLGLKVHADLTRQHVESKRRAERGGR